MNAAVQQDVFSLREFARIIDVYRPIIVDFADILREPDIESFCLMRHDVEFSLGRALQMAELEAEYNIPSTFFIQVKNAAYNPLAPLNAKIVRRIRELGRQVGLHFYITDIVAGDEQELLRQLAFQRMILEEALGEKVDRFSFHRPPLWVLKLDLTGKTDLINAYAPQFFELTESGMEVQHIKYMADSQHHWKYGHPLDDRKHYKKFQILAHPDEWSPDGTVSAADNFRELTALHRADFIVTLDNECNHFRQHFPTHEI